jgi:hypothetical protein
MALNFPEQFLDRLTNDPRGAEALIKDFVNEKRFEDLHLDFKVKSDGTKAAPSESDRANLSKAMSAFANSDGGLIVWGVKAKQGHDPEIPDVASELVPLRNVDGFHSQLNDLIFRAMVPSVPGIRNIKVTRQANREEGYVVTYVPAGDVPPYRAEFANRQFYKRSGNCSYPMEPFDIRDLVSRGRFPKIRIEPAFKHFTGTSDHVELFVNIRNDGPTVLESWKLVLEFSNALVPPERPHLANRANEAPFIAGPDTGAWRRFELRSASYGNAQHTAIYPEDAVAALGEHGISNCRIVLRPGPEVEREGRPINWRFYGWNIPMQTGSLLLNGDTVRSVISLAGYPR